MTHLDTHLMILLQKKVTWYQRKGFTYAEVQNITMTSNILLSMVFLKQLQEIIDDDKGAEAGQWLISHLLIIHHPDIIT